MRKNISCALGDTYDVGCTGRTVFVYDKSGCQLAKFNDLIYVYGATISPLGDIFAVKSADGWLAVYSLNTLSLIRKFRYSGVKYAQDDGFCFSEDGRCFINIERQGDDLHTAISVYDTVDFSLMSQTLFGDELMLEHVESVDGELYVSGFTRDSEMVITGNFIAKYRDGLVADAVTVSACECAEISEVMKEKSAGATSQKMRHVLKEIWSRNLAKAQCV